MTDDRKLRDGTKRFNLHIESFVVCLGEYDGIERHSEIFISCVPQGVGVRIVFVKKCFGVSVD